MPEAAAGWSAVNGKASARITRDGDDLRVFAGRGMSIPIDEIPALLAALTAIASADSYRRGERYSGVSWSHSIDAGRIYLNGPVTALDVTGTGKWLPARRIEITYVNTESLYSALHQSQTMLRRYARKQAARIAEEVE
jgi:hypothetical protein